MASASFTDHELVVHISGYEVEKGQSWKEEEFLAFGVWVVAEVKHVNDVIFGALDEASENENPVWVICGGCKNKG